ncbi:pyridoxal-phosphate dependent enzyme [Nitratireductor sp. CAU 1489]|uniref:Pyridoxal-phosphate dependent enzyme n=1 Tax=Nitratireductor arenosus TaxID=2682096 RepID=A0A844QKG5_9HYPH|nr:threonine/serine dehydratase [Nitratireductor arenosus]MVA98149.1 pyridoxal-phosphate dependent enzyme [Nitratireductor arenosus]
MNSADTALPGIADIRTARARLHGVALETPLLESPTLNARHGARILVKAETLQRTGSFKLRGAYNRIAQLDQAQRARGVVAFSSGNHAQGVAAAAKIFGMRAVIAMPADTPAIKTGNVKALGAEIVAFDRFRDDRMAMVRPFVDKGMVLVPPFDDPAIIAGQGTVGLELAEQAKAANARLDMVLVPCGGGGLTAGIALALEATAPQARVWAVEPENFDDWASSLAAGEIVANRPGHASVCDAILTAAPGAIPFAINRGRLAGALTVNDDAALAAMREVAEHLKLVVEPGGAVGLAALASPGLDIAGKTVAVVLSGGNVDPALLARALGGTFDR